MKHAMTDVAGALAVVTLCATAATARTSIDFRAMPVGCQWTTHFADGKSWQNTYTGRTTAGYVIRANILGKPKEIVKTTYFNAAGQMIRRSWTKIGWPPLGGREDFKPYNCLVPGRVCSFYYSNSNGGTNRVVVQATERNGVYSARYDNVGGRNLPLVTMRFGPYGIEVKLDTVNDHERVSDFRHCGTLPRS